MRVTEWLRICALSSEPIIATPNAAPTWRTVVFAPLATPELSRCGVAGVTRDRVIEAAARDRLQCRVEPVSKASLLGADEIFLTNSLTGVWPVRELDGWGRAPGPLTRKAQRWLERETDDQVA